jgi:hypothetical protein
MNVHHDDNCDTIQMNDEFIIRVKIDDEIDDCEFVSLSQLVDMYIQKNILKQPYVKRNDERSTSYDYEMVIVIEDNDEHVVYIEDYVNDETYDYTFDVPFIIRIPCDEEFINVEYVELTTLCKMYREYLTTL